MLLIVASSQDDVAHELAVRWQQHDACVLTPRDLSREGWRYQLPVRQWRGVLGERSFADEDLCGVLSRLTRVSEVDLAHIVAEDRGYVAAEMTAFLTAWLGGLRCPVLHAATPGCLAGPDWRRERWVHLAAQLGIQVRPLALDTSGEDEVLSSDALTAVTIVGERVVDPKQRDEIPVLVEQVRRLARTAGVTMLTAYFEGDTEDAVFLDASPWPDLSRMETSDLVLERLLRGSRC